MRVLDALVRVGEQPVHEGVDITSPFGLVVMSSGMPESDGLLHREDGSPEGELSEEPSGFVDSERAIAREGFIESGCVVPDKTSSFEVRGSEGLKGNKVVHEGYRIVDERSPGSHEMGSKRFIR